MKQIISLILLLFLFKKCKSRPDGALISVQFKSRIGFLLDEIPVYSLDLVKDYIKTNITNDQWMTKIKMQISATINRQIFRINYFGPKLKLTLPPKQVWNISFTSSPFEEIVQGHAYISRNYSFVSYLIGTASTLNASEPLLVDIDGQFTDVFILPADSEHVFQR